MGTEAYLNAYAAASAASSYNDLIKTLPNTISVTKTDKKTVAVGSGNKNQTPSSSKPDAAAKIPPSVSVSKTNKSGNMLSKPKAPNLSGAASLQPCKPKLFSAATASGPMNPAIKSKLLPSTSSKSGGAKSASALAIEKIYKKAPSSAVMKQKTSLPGVTVSKVLSDNKVGSKKNLPPALVPVAVAPVVHPVQLAPPPSKRLMRSSCMNEMPTAKGKQTLFPTRRETSSSHFVAF